MFLNNEDPKRVQDKALLLPALKRLNTERERFSGYFCRAARSEPRFLTILVISNFSV